MTEPRHLNLILCWHMHQPDYRDYISGDFVLPWTYLHATKDYTDMAFHLERTPQARAVVNFVPVLLDQLEDYAQQFASGNLRDPLLRLLAEEDMNALSPTQRDLLLDRCFRCNHVTMIEPYPAYQRLYKMFREIDAREDGHFEYLSGQYFADLVTWYHLIWTGESVRRNSELVPRLMSQGSLFSYADRAALLRLYGELITGLIPRYRALLADGRIELSSTPHYHPIAPLLLDLKSAREAMPDSPLPEAPAYPGGRERLQFHIESAIASHKARFGRAPSGLWPAEGAISSAALSEMAAQGMQWAASGEGVLANSLRASTGTLPPRPDYLYRPYRVGDGRKPLHCFFRDDRMSDLIGFEYSKWSGNDAVTNFVHELEEILTRAPATENPVVSVILDGENAWEYYPYNGYYFLSELYVALAAHPHIRMTTFEAYLRDQASGKEGGAAAGRLPQITTGSWVFGNLATWIGEHDKNRAWDLLCAAKQSYDLVMASARLSESERAAASQQLADCESSDWFWWFGGYNPAHSVATFDWLFRSNLMHLYHHLQLPVPPALEQAISHGGAASVEAGGAMRRGS